MTPGAGRAVLLRRRLPRPAAKPRAAACFAPRAGMGAAASQPAASGSSLPSSLNAFGQALLDRLVPEVRPGCLRAAGAAI